MYDQHTIVKNDNRESAETALRRHLAVQHAVDAGGIKAEDLSARHKSVHSVGTRVTLSIPLGYSGLYIPGSRTRDSARYAIFFGKLRKGEVLWHAEGTYDWFPVSGDAVYSIQNASDVPYS